MPAGGCDAPNAVELHAAELLDAIAPLVEGAPQLFHALAIVMNPRPGALGKSLGAVGRTSRHTRNTAILVRVPREPIAEPWLCAPSPCKFFGSNHSSALIVILLANLLDPRPSQPLLCILLSLFTINFARST
jgi:hypothetical protein